MSRPSEFWDALAPHHSAIENNYLELRSLRRMMHEIRDPVLVVGAGQGLIMAELQRKGFHCDGVDLSSEMVRYAKLRRGLTLVEADARAMPFGEATYGTIIYATGAVDFIGDEEEIRVILDEGRRIVNPSGNIFVAFYRLSTALEGFLSQVGLLRNNVLSHKESLRTYLLNPVQMMGWVARQARVGYVRAATLLLRLSVLCTVREKATTFKMQRIFRNLDAATSLINAAPETQPYRNETEIRKLFQRLAIPIKQLEAFGSCYIVTM